MYKQPPLIKNATKHVTSPPRDHISTVDRTIELFHLVRPLVPTLCIKTRLDLIGSHTRFFLSLSLSAFRSSLFSRSLRYVDLMTYWKTLRFSSAVDLRIGVVYTMDLVAPVWFMIQKTDLSCWDLRRSVEELVTKPIVAGSDVWFDWIRL